LSQIVKAAALEIVGAGAARAGESDVAVSDVCFFFEWLRWGRRAMRVVSNVTHYADVSNII
jgi:hypothetical protein